MTGKKELVELDERMPPSDKMVENPFSPSRPLPNKGVKGGSAYSFIPRQIKDA